MNKFDYSRKDAISQNRHGQKEFTLYISVSKLVTEEEEEELVFRLPCCIGYCLDETVAKVRCFSYNYY